MANYSVIKNFGHFSQIWNVQAESDCKTCKPKTGELITVVSGLFNTYGIVRVGRRIHKIPLEKLRFPEGD